MGVSVPVAAAVVAAGTTLYATNQAKKTAEREADNANNLAAQSKAEADKIDGPTGQNTATQLQAAEQRAATAGGTLTGTGGNRVGDLSSTPRRTLLGG